MPIFHEDEQGPFSVGPDKVVYTSDTVFDGLTPYVSSIYNYYVVDGIPLEFLDEYDDHQDDYSDPIAQKFKKEYADKEGVRKALLELMVMRMQHKTRKNYGHTPPPIEDLIGQLNITGNDRITSEKDSCKLLEHKDYTPFYRRLCNMALRKYCEATFAEQPGEEQEFKAELKVRKSQDLGKIQLFGTRPRGAKTRCCPNCDTEFTRSKFIIELGPEGTQKGYDNLLERGDPNKWPKNETPEPDEE